MKNIIVFLLLTATGLVGQTPPHNNEAVYSFGGALAHFLDGDGWTTTLTLVNLDPTQASFTLSFFGDNGSPQAFTISGASVTTVTGTIAGRGTVVLATPGTKAGLSQGWVKMDSYNTIGGTAVFQRLGQNLEASEVLDTNLSTQLALPFDHTNGYATGIALVNPFSYTGATITVTFRDENGNIFLTDSISLTAQQHIGITLTQRYPSTIGRRGTVSFQTNQLWLNALGSRFSPSGAFSTVTAMSALFW